MEGGRRRGGKGIKGKRSKKRERIKGKELGCEKELRNLLRVNERWKRRTWNKEQEEKDEAEVEMERVN